MVDSYGRFEGMEDWIKNEYVDYVVLARALIADPDLPKKAMHHAVCRERGVNGCLITFFEVSQKNPGTENESIESVRN